MKKILIANRGEISCRAQKACREISLPCVAVYTDQDAMSEHVLKAEESYCLGSDPKEYLNGDRLIEVCRETGMGSPIAYLMINSMKVTQYVVFCSRRC